MMRRATVEESRSITLDNLERQNLLKTGCRFTVSWKENGQPSGDMTVRVVENGVRLEYESITRSSEELIDDVYEFVELEWNAPGGYRVYFLCPGCKARARNLHMPPGSTRFRCRACHNLAYESQRETLSFSLRMQPNQDIRPRWGFNIRGQMNALELGEQFLRSVRSADIKVERDRLIRSVMRSYRPAGRPGRPSKKAIRKRQKREKLRSQGLVDLFGNPIPQKKRRPGRPKEKRNYVWQQPKEKRPVKEGEAYCVKCKCARKMIYARATILSNGRSATKGLCQVCRTRMCRLTGGKRIPTN